MEDYAKMYAVLCGAIDDVIDGLEALPGAAEYAQHLKAALLQTEEIYCGGGAERKSLINNPRFARIDL